MPKRMDSHRKVASSRAKPIRQPARSACAASSKRAPKPQVVPAPQPPNEEARLEALRRYGILDTDPEAEFDEIALLASQICGTPMALVTLIDARRQWFKARVNIPLREAPREVSFCAHAILDPNELTIIPDTLDDPRFMNHPSVVDDPKIRFYAGAPLVTPDGFALGTICVMDRTPHDLTPEQARALGILSRQIVARLELRRALSELSETQRGLRESEARLQAMIDNSTAVIYLKDSAGRYILVNRQYEKLFNVTRQAIRGKTDFDIFPADAARAFQENDRKVLAAAVPIESEEIVPQADGLHTYISIKFPLFDTSDKPYAVCGISTDITERKRMEQEVRQREEFFHSLIQNALDIISVVDPAGVIQFQSPSIERVLGYKPDELKGRGAFEFVHPDDLPEVVRKFTEAVQNPGVPQSVNYRYRHKNGSWIPLESIGRLVRDASGSLVGIINSRDISFRRPE